MDFNMEALKFYNGYGGFRDDGKSYLIKINIESGKYDRINARC